MGSPSWNRKYPDYWDCKECKTPFKNKTGHPRVFCSYACYWKDKKKSSYPGTFKNGPMHWNWNKNRSALIDRKHTRFTTSMCNAIMKRANHKCEICGVSFSKVPLFRQPIKTMSFDHIIPIGLGGIHNLDNGQLLCRLCNKNKTHEDRIRIHHVRHKR